MESVKYKELWEDCQIQGTFADMVLLSIMEGQNVQ